VIFTSSITRGDGKPAARDLGEILDPLDETLARGIVTAWAGCAKTIQAEVLKRVPVGHGTLRSAFGSPDAIQETERHHFRFGLLTPELRRMASYWHYVEYGTRGHGPIARTYVDAQGHVRRRVLPATAGRHAHPFLRPGIVAGRRRYIEILSHALAIRVGGLVGIGAANALAKGFTIKLKDIDAKVNEAER
jgi:hypothetical protein